MADASQHGMVREGGEGMGEREGDVVGNASSPVVQATLPGRTVADALFGDDDGSDLSDVELEQRAIPARDDEDEDEDEDEAGQGAESDDDEDEVDEYKDRAEQDEAPAVPKAKTTGPLPSFKKVKKASAGTGDGASPTRKPKVKRPRRPRSPSPTSLGQDIVLDPIELKRREIAQSIDNIVKPKSKRKKADEEDLTADLDEKMDRLKDEMWRVADLDQESNAARAPALAKLKMLPKVIEALQNTTYTDAILENNVLNGVRRWLEPLPDRSLPALNVQKALFGALEKMQIETQYLRTSGLGKVVLFYTKCPRVDPRIRKSASFLVTNWSRPIIKQSASFRDKPVHQIDVNLADLRQKGYSEAMTKLRKEDEAVANGDGPGLELSKGAQAAQERLRAAKTRIPQSVAAAYDVAPLVQSDLLAARSGQNASKKGPGRFGEISRKLALAKKESRAY